MYGHPSGRRGTSVRCRSDPSPHQRVEGGAHQHTHRICQQVSQAGRSGRQPALGQFQGRTADAREYWLRCTLTGKASLSGVNIKNDIQMAPLAMPSMTVGDNRFTYVEHTDNQTAANTARRVSITHHWVERSSTFKRSLGR